MKRKQDVLATFEGIMGDGLGNVQVTEAGKENFSYVRINDTVQKVLNTRIPLQEGIRVIVGYDASQPDLLQILGTRTATPYGSTGRVVNRYAPASYYEWMGSDPIFIDKRLWLPRRISCLDVSDPLYTGLSVRMYWDMFWDGTSWIVLPSQIIDLSSYTPASGKSAFVLVTLNSAGAVICTKGSEITTASILPIDIPAPPSGTSDVLAAVRLYYGQTDIVETITTTDILDLRFTYFGSGGAGVEALAGQIETSDGSGGIIFQFPNDAAEMIPSFVWDIYKLGVDTDNLVLSLGAGGSWDATMILHPCAVLHDGIVYLFYSGYNGSAWKIGVATDDEVGFTGVNFSKYGSNPILSGTVAQWDATGVSDPWVIYDEDASIWKMWYRGYGTNGIGYATASNPFGPWTKSGSNPILTPTVAWEDSLILTFSVLRESVSSYKMLYSGNDPAGPAQIGLATSTNGISWTKYSGNPVLSPIDLVWMAASVFSPRTFMKVGNYYQIYFCGKQTTSGFSACGYAISSNLHTWQLGVDNPLLTSTRTWEGIASGEVENPNLLRVGAYQYLFYDAWFGAPPSIGVAVAPYVAPYVGPPMTVSDTSTIDLTLSGQDISGAVLPGGFTLNQIGSPTADLSINTHKLTNVVDPGSDQDAATKHYVDIHGVATGKYRQWLYSAAGGNLTILTDSNGNPLTGLCDLE